MSRRRRHSTIRRHHGEVRLVMPVLFISCANHCFSYRIVCIVQMAMIVELNLLCYHRPRQAVSAISDHFRILCNTAGVVGSISAEHRVLEVEKNHIPVVQNIRYVTQSATCLRIIDLVDGAYARVSKLTENFKR